MSSCTPPDEEAISPSFVGRRRELTLLWEQFHIAVGGQPRVALVTGEPGIGKTRLLNEVAARANSEGAPVLRGGASEAEGMPPYLPFLEALGQHIRTTTLSQLRSEVGLEAAVLSCILPELVSRLGEITPTCELPAEQARLRLYEAVGAFLASIAASSPLGGVLFILDDLQWVDAASLDLLCHIVHHQPSAGLFVVGACRTCEITQNPVLEKALAELNRLRVLTTFVLAPLLADEVAALAADHLHGLVHPSAGQALHAQSEGNPFFAEELLRDWLETGALAKRVDVLAGGSHWALSTSKIHTLPPSIVGAIRLRLARLEPTVVDQLRIASVVGRDFDVGLLAQVQDRNVEQVEEYLLPAEHAGLIRGDQQGGFAFSHDKTRECLYSEVSHVRRRHLHERIGLALEARPGLDDILQLADLAFHFAHSGDRARGVMYAERAAEQALRIHAPQQAMSHYQTALGLIEPNDSRRGELLMNLGEAALLAAAEDRASAAYAAAQAWFEQAGDPVATARAAHGCGLAHWRLDETDMARQAFEIALSHLESLPRPPPETLRILVDLANLLGIVMGRQDAAIAHGRRAVEIACDLGDAVLEAAANRTVGFLLVRENDIATGVPLLQRALALARANGDMVECAECCGDLAQVYCWLAEIEHSRQVSRLREQFALAGRLPYHLCYVYTWLAFLSAAQGDWSGAECSIAQSQPAVERVASTEPLAFWRQVRGFLAFQRGDYALAECELRAAIEAFRHQDPGELVLCLGLFGLALLGTGKRQEALDCMAEQESLIAKLSAGYLPTLSARGCLALMAVSMGDQERACRYYSDLLACQGQHHWFLVDRILGLVATANRDWANAKKHLDDAMTIAQREGLRPEQGRILVAQADLELAQGGPRNAVRARAKLAQASALFREIGCDVRDVRHKLRSLPPQPGTPLGKPFPAGLSQREAEVLRLVAAGKSNHQVAQMLALSENTVAKHLTSIFNKTGCDNRAAAVAFAIRHGLA